MKGVTKTIKNKIKEQKERFLSMLLGTLGANLLRSILVRKGILKLVLVAVLWTPLLRMEIKKEKELKELFVEKNGIIHAASSLNKLWNTKVLSELAKI